MNEPSAPTMPPALSEPLPPASLYHQRASTTSEPLLPASLYRQQASIASDPPALSESSAYTASELAPSESPHRQEATSLYYIQVHTSGSCLCPTIIPPEIWVWWYTASYRIEHPATSYGVLPPMVFSVLERPAFYGIRRTTVSGVLQRLAYYSVRRPITFSILQRPTSYCVQRPTASSVLQRPASHSTQRPTASSVLQRLASYSV